MIELGHHIVLAKQYVGSISGLYIDQSARFAAADNDVYHSPKEFAERDWELRFMTCGLETLNTSYAGGLGVTIPSGKTICVDVNASAFLRDNTTVLHEMGHFEEQYASAQEEAAITNAFQKEQVLMAAFLHRDYCRKNVEEYFAEVFRAYLLGKDFSETEPLTWSAMEMLSRTWEADT